MLKFFTGSIARRLYGLLCLFALKEMIDNAKANGSAYESYVWTSNSNETFDKVTYAQAFKPFGWVIAFGVLLTDVQAIFFKSAFTSGPIAAGIILAMMALGAVIGRGVTKPLGRLGANMVDLADSKYDIDIKGHERTDEIGTMVKAVEVFRGNGLKVAHMTEHEIATALRTQAERRQMMSELQQGFGNVVDAAIAGDFSKRVPTSWCPQEQRSADRHRRSQPDAGGLDQRDQHRRAADGRDDAAQRGAGRRDQRLDRADREPGALTRPHCRCVHAGGSARAGDNPQARSGRGSRAGQRRHQTPCRQRSSRPPRAILAVAIPPPPPRNVRNSRLMTPASPSSVARTAVRLPAATDGKAGGAGLTPALLLAGLGLAVAIAGYYAPPTVGEMAVVFPPGTSEAATFSLILKAGGHFVGPTRFSNIAIAYADTPGFAARVRAEGGLFTLAAHGLCGPISSIQGNTA